MSYLLIRKVVARQKCQEDNALRRTVISHIKKSKMVFQRCHRELTITKLTVSRVCFTKSQAE